METAAYIKAIDPDVFDESNLNRQLLLEQSLIGYPKAKAAQERVQRINSHIKVEPIIAEPPPTGGNNATMSPSWTGVSVFL